MTDVAADKNRRTYKGRQRAHQEVQTEASFVPGCKSLSLCYDPLASEQYENLIELRQTIQSCLALVAGDVYDVVAFKDILFQLESEMPSTLPVTDLLLLSSRLFRRTAELGRLLGTFFGVVFAEDHDDEHYRFAEVRLLQREIRDLKRQLRASEDERVRLKDMLDNVGQVAYDHGKAVELLETHNKVLKKQTTALEDQMALLFHQLNTGLEGHCKDAFQQVTGEMRVQESLSPARITFRQTMDSLSEQLRGSRGLITDIREVLLSCSQGARTGEAYATVEPSVRFKLKMLESNFQQLMGRFTAIKDTVVETAQELMSALQERKKILYLSFQHIRLYDLQNAKLRNSRAILSQMQQNASEVAQRIRATFPGGNLTSVDRFGNISTQRWRGGYTLATLQGYKQGEQALQNKQLEEGEPVETKRGSISRLPSTVGPRRSPNGLTEAQIMAAETEMAVLEGSVRTPSFGTAGGQGNNLNSRQLQSSISSLSHRLPQAPNTTTSRAASARNSVAGFAASPGAMAPGTSGGDDPDVTPFDSINSFLSLMQQLESDMDELQRALVLDDEMGAFLKMLTLSASTTARADAVESAGNFGRRASQLERLEFFMETALQPPGTRFGGGQGGAGQGAGSVFSESFSPRENEAGSPGSAKERPISPGDGRGGVSRIDNTISDATVARQASQLLQQQKQMTKMQEDFASKIGFLRQVYEARISDLEVRESTAHKRLAQSWGAFSSREGADGSVLHGTSNGIKSEEDRLNPSSQKDKEKLGKLRKEWHQSKRKMQANRKLRAATTEQIEDAQQDMTTL